MTHLEVINPADYKRFKQLNVTADMQVAGDFTQPSVWSENKVLIGDRANNLIPLKSLYEAGANIANLIKNGQDKSHFSGTLSRNLELFYSY